MSRKLSKSDQGPRKPSWGRAPCWANYLAMDADGEWLWHESMPVINSMGWMSALSCTHAASCSADDFDWKKTLERRP